MKNEPSTIWLTRLIWTWGCSGSRLCSKPCWRVNCGSLPQTSYPPERPLPSGECVLTHDAKCLSGEGTSPTLFFYLSRSSLAPEEQLTTGYLVLHSATWLPPVTVGMIQFDFGKDMRRGIHLMEPQDRIFHSCLQSYWPSSPRPRGTPCASLPLCLLLSPPRILFLGPLHGLVLGSWNLLSLAEVPKKGFTSATLGPVTSHSFLISFFCKGLIFTWKYNHCCASPAGCLLSDKVQRAGEGKVIVQIFSLSTI